MKNNVKALWGVIAVVVVIIGATFFIGDNETTSYSASALTAQNTSHDFGTIEMGDGKVTHEFMIENDGDEPVVIQKIYTSCMCTTARITDSQGNESAIFGMQGHGGPLKADTVVSPGETATVTAIFDPAAHGPSGVGLAQRSIYLETNSSLYPKLELRFQATVTNN